jgi:hypothetical protein
VDCLQVELSPRGKDSSRETGLYVKVGTQAANSEGSQQHREMLMPHGVHLPTKLDPQEEATPLHKDHPVATIIRLPQAHLDTIKATPLISIPHSPVLTANRLVGHPTMLPKDSPKSMVPHLPKTTKQGPSVLVCKDFPMHSC